MLQFLVSFIFVLFSLKVDVCCEASRVKNVSIMLTVQLVLLVWIEIETEFYD